MNCYLVDYENVGPEGLNGIDELDEGNIIHIFYSKNADKITFEIHIQLNQSKSEIFYHKADASHKNALDFQLSSYLGWLVHDNPEYNYFIVSKDNGFSSLVPFWKKHKINISLVADLAKQNIQENINSITSQVLELTKDNENAGTIANIILSYKTKQGINNALVKLFDTKRAGEIYKAIKSLIADKKGR